MARCQVIYAGPFGGSELVALSVAEHAEATAVGDRWHATAAGYDEVPAAEGLDYDRLGACGELCVARALGLDWRPRFEPYRGPDVGIYHVRAAHRPTDRLKIKIDDPDAGLFVLVVPWRHPRTYRIVGIMRGLDGKRVGWAGDPTGRGLRPAYWVPQAELSPWADRPFV